MKYILSLFVVALCMISCEEIPVEIPSSDVELSGKTVLLEELTGVSCPNCPSGAKVIESIVKQYPDNVIPVAIHGVFLCEPIKKEGYESKYDFRNDEGKYLENYLMPFFSKPAAYFNRVHKEGENSFGNSKTGGEWLQRTEEELAKEQVIEISASSSYDEATRTATINTGIAASKDLEGSFTLTIMVLESKIVDSQSDQSAVVKDYEHNHVLVDIVTEFSGDPIGSKLTKGQSITKPYTYTIPDREEGRWKAENMSFVVFVSDVSDSKEVLQAKEIHVK